MKIRRVGAELVHAKRQERRNINKIQQDATDAGIYLL